MEKARQTQTISEEQARALLEQERIETEQRLKKAGSQRKKVLTLVIVAVVFLAVIAIGAGLLANREKGDEEKEPIGAGEIETTEEIAKRLYRRFQVGAGQAFYGAELGSLGITDEGREKARLELALNNLEPVACKVTAENGGLAERYGEKLENLYEDEKVAIRKCYNGAQVRAKYQELFGNIVELNEGKFGAIEGKEPLYDGVFWNYDEDNDEFYNTLGGTDAGGRLVQGLERTEAEGDKMYLYERVLSLNCWPDPQFDEEGNQYGGGSSCGVTVVAPSCGTAEFGWTGAEMGLNDKEILEKAEEKGIGLLKWTFRKGPTGEYIFESLERVN